jgi:D-alanyl-D-alanine carboxypeptidase
MQLFFRLFLSWNICFLFFSEISSAFSALLKKNPYCAVVMDPESGAVLGGERFSAAVYPASLTKLMTLLLLFDVLKKNKVSLNSLFRISEKASRQPPCKLGLKKGQKISVEDCILALAVRSANDVAMVVAENLGGSEKTFVKAMNKKAQLIGLKNTFFVNPSGWHHPAQKTTALDIAHLVQFIWREYPEYTSFLCQPCFSRNKQIYYTTNKLVGVVDGLKISKTGYTGPAGYGLATLTERNQQARIVVVIGKKERKARDQEVGKLIHLAYSQPNSLYAFFQNTGSTIPENQVAKANSQSFEVSELAEDLLKLSKQSLRALPKKKMKKWGGKKLALKSIKVTPLKKAQKPKARTKRLSPYIPWDRV